VTGNDSTTAAIVGDTNTATACGDGQTARAIGGRHDHPDADRRSGTGAITHACVTSQPTDLTAGCPWCRRWGATGCDRPPLASLRTRCRRGRG
jgi:hypothetical protein